MDISILDAEYQKTAVLNDYIACVWTEQYSNTGNFELVVPATPDLYALLAPGTHIDNSKSDEIGTILTRQVKDDKITVKGPFQLGLFNYRTYRDTFYTHGSGSEYGPTSVGQIIEHMVQYACLTPWSTGDAFALSPFPDYTRDNLENFAIGSCDARGPQHLFSVPYGNLLPTIIKIVNEYGAGIRLHVDRPSQGSSYTLTFTLYYGVDRSADVVFSPAFDSLMNSEEFDSAESYYNVCYAYTPNVLVNSDEGGKWAIGIADNAAGLTNWNRRVMQVLYDDISDPPSDLAGWTDLKNLLSARAASVLANNNYVKLADGELVPQSGFDYGVAYFLGDIIGLEGLFGTRQKARVIEFIRSQDATGYKEYPTLSVI